MRKEMASELPFQIREHDVPRILIIDDNLDIHDDFRKILMGAQPDSELDKKEILVFGKKTIKKNQNEMPTYQVDFATQGQEGIELVRKGREEGFPYALAFVDIRMPPGFDGIETIDQIWKIDSEIQTVICTAYSDQSWDEITRRLHISDRLLILKKPFDVIEIRQLACALFQKWKLNRLVQNQIRELKIHIEERSILLRESLSVIEEKKRINNMKDEFIATVNHELRTPLTAMQGSLDMLVGGVAGEIRGDALKLLEIARNNGKRLIRLINDILDIEKIESGKNGFNFRLIEISKLVQECITETKLYGEGFGVRIKLEQDLPNVVVFVDSDKAIQVLENLISNAIKFSPRGGEVTVSITQKENKVSVAVRDKGPGIPEEFQSKIFQKFLRGDNSLTRERGGTGLGLSISKAISEKMKGTIYFETSKQGTTFYFDLPIVDSKE